MAAAVAMLAERYFQGVCPLFPEVEEQIGWIVAQGERLVEMFNNDLDTRSTLRRKEGRRTSAPAETSRHSGAEAKR